MTSHRECHSENGDRHNSQVLCRRRKESSHDPPTVEPSTLAPSTIRWVLHPSICVRFRQFSHPEKCSPQPHNPCVDSNTGSAYWPRSRQGFDLHMSLANCLTVHIRAPWCARQFRLRSDKERLRLNQSWVC